MRRSEAVGEARRLKTLHYSNRKIAKVLVVRTQYVSRWTNELKFTSLGYRGIVQQQYMERKKFYNLDRISVGNISRKEAILYASLLYWCEGSKYPSDNRVNFTNSDPEMQKVFWLLMRKAFDLQEGKLRVWLQIHSSHNEEKIVKYWSRILNIPKNQFMKPKVTEKRGGKYRKVYFGTCSVRYSDYRIQLRLMGVYNRFGHIVTRTTLI